jgi:hypothetical protein
MIEAKKLTWPPREYTPPRERIPTALFRLKVE